MALLLALLIAHQAYTMPLRALPARVARETASFSTTAEASIVASFQPLLAERLAAWAVVPMGQTGYRRFRRCARCVGVRAPPRSGRGRPSGWDAGDCESSGAVRATQCAQGDDAMRAAAEDLVALPLAIARAVALRVNDAVDPHGESRLLIEDGTHTNKLAVVEVNGAGYAKHVDNVMGAGMGDARKLTAIYYLNPHYDERVGGALRVWDAEVVGAGADGPLCRDGAARVAPRGDRLVVFWSDALVHDVEPSHIASSADDRWALTVWHIATEPDADPSLAHGLGPMIAYRHFDAPASELARPARRLVSRKVGSAVRRLAGMR